MPGHVAESYSPVLAEHDRGGCDWPKLPVVTGIDRVSSSVYHFWLLLKISLNGF